MTDFVFAYGSLLELVHAGPCVLRDHRRGWDVAMDNRVTIPGYKFYVDPETGERPPVYVTYLAIAPEPGSAVAGAVFAVDAARSRRSTGASATTTAARSPAWSTRTSAGACGRTSAARPAARAVRADGRRAPRSWRPSTSRWCPAPSRRTCRCGRYSGVT